MTRSVGGPLYWERLGRSGPPIVFLHPLPHDLTAWLHQLASFSSEFRAIAIDLPGHGRSPRAPAGISMPDVAEACWAAVDEAAKGEPVVLVGCSIGSVTAKHMANQRPDRVRALVLTGGGVHADPTAPDRPGPKGIAPRHLPAYRERGTAYRREHLASNFSAAFRSTERADVVVELVMSRDAAGDTEGTQRLLEAIEPADPPWLHAGIRAPTLIVAGGEDRSRARQEELHRRIAGSELHVIDGAGHACMIERPREYDGLVLAFLHGQGLALRPSAIPPPPAPRARA